MEALRTLLEWINEKDCTVTGKPGCWVIRQNNILQTHLPSEKNCMECLPNDRGFAAMVSVRKKREDTCLAGACKALAGWPCPYPTDLPTRQAVRCSPTVHAASLPPLHLLFPLPGEAFPLTAWCFPRVTVHAPPCLHQLLPDHESLSYGVEIITGSMAHKLRMKCY